MTEDNGTQFSCIIWIDRFTVGWIFLSLPQRGMVGRKWIAIVILINGDLNEESMVLDLFKGSKKQHEDLILNLHIRS